MYTKRYTYQTSLPFIIVILAFFIIGIMYIFVAKVSFAGFILVSIASVSIVYWTIYFNRILGKEGIKGKYIQEEMKDKSWVYDLIKGNGEIVFVAEVPGPEEAVNVKLVNNILYIKGGQGFFKEVPLDNAENMSIAEFKYKNGILTLKIKKL